MEDPELILFQTDSVVWKLKLLGVCISRLEEKPSSGRSFGYCLLSLQSNPVWFCKPSQIYVLGHIMDKGPIHGAIYLFLFFFWKDINNFI